MELMVKVQAKQAMETHEEKVYVAVGKNVEEGNGILRWALNHWSSQSVTFVIIHINARSKDFVLTPSK